MKRPLATVGMSVLLTLAVFCFLPSWSVIAALPILGLGLGVCLLRPSFRYRSYVLLSLCAALMSALLFMGEDAAQRRLASRVAGAEYAAVIQISDRTQYDDLYYYRASVLELDGKSVDGLTIRFYQQAAFETGARYRGTFALDPLEEAEYGQTVQFAAELCGTANLCGVSWQYYADRFGQDVRENISKFLGGEEGALLGSMLTGDRSELPAETELALERSGMSHILAVSGLHVSIMLGMFGGLLRRFRCAEFTRFAVMTALGLLLVALYGAGSSIVRAVVMNWLAQCASVLGRQADSPTSLAAAALLILLLNPKTAGELGFLLSFSSCFALCAVVPAVREYLENRRGRKLGGAASSALSCLLITLVTFPVLVLYGLPVSLVAPLANFLLLATVGPMLALGLLVGLFGGITFLAPLFQLLALAAGVLARILILGNRLIGSFAFASVRLNDGFVRLWLLGALAVGAILLLRREKARPALIGLCLGLALLAGVLSKIALTADKDRIYLYENRAAACVSAGTAVLVCREAPDETEMQELLYWCDTRFIPSPEYVIILDGQAEAALLPDQAKFAESASLEGMEIEPLDSGTVAVQWEGGTLYLRFRPDWTADLLDGSGNSVLQSAHGWSGGEDEPADYAVYLGKQGEIQAVRER